MTAPATQPPTAPNEVENPIINSPFAEPAFHWRIEKGKPPVKAPGRRPASYFYRVPESGARGRKGKAQLSLLRDTAVGQQEDLHRVNWIRGRVKEWREAGWPGASGVTKELLGLWRAGSDRRAQRLFFAQMEAAETVIFLVEGAESFKRGMPAIPVDEPGAEAKAAGFRAFTRYACKMATGTGKTTVMGMLAAWSILNRVAEPTDDRFSDTVLVVCPNVTIRERLKELDPALGDLSLYRTRQLVPPERMEDLRRGEVMIANWHRLARQETSSVNGDSARVVKTGEPVAVVKNAGKANQTVEVRYFESDRAWLKRIRSELGNGRGRSPHWLVFNDEAHHAYRRGDAAEEVSLDETEEADRGTLAKKNAREATVWIEGLDRINKLAAGGRKKGIRLCVDLSATPFYIQGSGNEVGKPLPWVVSDFGLLDAIESGLVKVPQLPTRDITGNEEASYFNVWRWVEHRAVSDGHGSKLTPELVMTYATAPINQLAQDWHTRFLGWQKDQAGELHPVPPVFIVVCRDTRVASAVYDWLAEGKGAADAPPWFRNRPGLSGAGQVTVRIDSKVVEDMEVGGTKDETRRLRFILDTIGKKTWPGGKVPEEWSDLVLLGLTLIRSSPPLFWNEQPLPTDRRRRRKSRTEFSSGLTLGLSPARLRGQSYGRSGSGLPGTLDLRPALLNAALPFCGRSCRVFGRIRPVHGGVGLFDSLRRFRLGLVAGKHVGLGAIGVEFVVRGGGLVHLHARVRLSGGRGLLGGGHLVRGGLSAQHARQ